MTDTSAEGNATALSEDAAELKAPTLDDFASPKPEVESEPEVQDEVEVKDENESQDQEEEESEGIEQPEEEDESEEGEVLSQEIDIEQIPDEERVDYLDSIYEALNDEDRRKWLSNRDGRVGKDMGKMRHKAAEAESRAEAAEAKYQELQAKSFYSDNPFASVLDGEKLDAYEGTVNNSIAEARKFLRSDDSYYTDANGKEFDRAAVDNWLDSLLADKDAIPKQRERIRAISRAKEKAEKSEEQLKDSYSWLEDDSSDSYKAYKKLRNDPKWSMVADLIPELAGELPKVLAKYVDGDSSAKPATKRAKVPIRGKRKPKGDLGSASTATRRKPKAQIQARERLFSGSANEADELAMFR